jgi:hypothetical protein
MSAGSGASNLGYGKIMPLSNVNSNYVNVTSSNNPSNFSSNEIPGLPGLAGAKNNVHAASGNVPGICLFKGGSKNIKRKIKNITKKYKMKGGSKKLKSLKNKIKARYASRSLARAMAMARVGGRKTRRHRKHRKTHMRGGWAQYQNNLPMTPTYSVGGILPASQLGLANPPPISVLPNCTNCVDNYNHYTNIGFPSRGH